MSGASGKVPAAIHLTPEAADGGPVAKVREGDVVRIDAVAGRLDALVGEAEWAGREPASADLSRYHAGLGRDLFAPFRAAVGRAEEVAAVGAAFAVSPGATPSLLDAAARSPVPLLPGTATASEVMAVLERGYTHMKLFPAEPAGGVELLASLAS